MLALSAGVACGGTAALTPLLTRAFPDFRSREAKPGTNARDAAAGLARRLPLVGGLAFWAAVGGALVLMAVARRSSHFLVLLAVLSAFGLFGLADDLAKRRACRGVREGWYFVAALILAVGSAALAIGTGLPAEGARSPFALARWLGTQDEWVLGAWYSALILGTALAAGFS
ncbi:MAG: hypothetical protein FJ029_04870, partial [Actinobacteria bacterium]|nr:hypothetical protein [Actinomycetota bacterium]